MCKWATHHLYITVCTVGGQLPSLKYLNRHVMKPVGSKWYNLGIDLLEVDDTEALNTIQSEHSTDANTCCTKMFQLWLRKQPTATWNQLIGSLRQPSIELNHLATRIEQMLVQPNATPAGTYACYCICVCHELLSQLAS